MSVTAVFAGSTPSYGVFPVATCLLRLVPNAIQDPHARLQFRRWNIIEQFMTKFERCLPDLFNDPLSARRQMDRLATAIMRCVFASDPAIALQSMQQCDKRWLFNPEVRGNLGLTQRTRSDRQVHQGAPFGLA
jgi:hypothetical protein